MSHRDAKCLSVRLNASCLTAALGWLLRGVDWSGVTFRRDCTWTPRLLAAGAMLWAWSDELTLVERFSSARRLVTFLFSPATPLAGSYQAFIKLLVRWTETLLGRLLAAWRGRMQRELSAHWCVLGFAMFGVDGSRCELPRTRSHEAAYSPTRTKKGKKKKKSSRRRAHFQKANSPQMWVTTMWHVGTGLPWDWRLGPSESSERAHLLEMISALPEEALITADAGFVGYQYWKAILDSGRHILIRVGANVRLLKQLGYVRESHGIVYLWPDREAARRQPPLVLRLVQAHNGKHPVFVVTSVLSAQRLSDRQVLELYTRRWGIELFYRHLKQTFQRKKLRSTSAEPALMELHWSLAGLWAMAFYALVQLAAADAPWNRLSIAQTLRAFRRTMRDYLHPAARGRSLRERLRTALIDSYRRENKASRNYPRKKQETPPGPPQLITATQTQVQQAQAIRKELRKRLTA
jgi:DDE family transposase